MCVQPNFIKINNILSLILSPVDRKSLDNLLLVYSHFIHKNKDNQGK